jgi:hypothetical protein
MTLNTMENIALVFEVVGIAPWRRLEAKTKIKVGAESDREAAP